MKIIDYRIKPQLLVELSQLYIAKLNEMKSNEEFKNPRYEEKCREIENRFKRRITRR